MGMIVRDAQPEMQGVALESMLERADVVIEVGGYALIDAVLSHATRMQKSNLVIVFKFFKQMDLTHLDDKHLVLIRTLMVALLDRIRSEFDVLHGDNRKKKEGEEGTWGIDTGDGNRGIEEHLCEWCMPAMEMLAKHHFLISAVSQNKLKEEKRLREETFGRMTLSEQAIMEQQHRRSSLELGGGSTVVAAGRLTEMLGKLMTHEHCEPAVLKMVCEILVSGIAEGQMGGFPEMVDALIACEEPERGDIILNALEKVRIGEDKFVKPLLKYCLGDEKMRR